MNQLKYKEVKVNVNAQNSICIRGEKVIYFDSYMIKEAKNDADYIFITHSHHDHFSPEDIKKVIKEDTRVIYPKSMKSIIKESGLNIKTSLEVIPNKKYKINGIKFETVSAYNNIKSFHLKKYGWVGYIITVRDTRIFICGDSSANKYNKKVTWDIAMLPIGGYYTMNAKEAAKLVNEIKPKLAIPTHYGSIIGRLEDGDTFKRLVNPEIQVELKLFKNN